MAGVNVKMEVDNIDLSAIQGHLQRFIERGGSLKPAYASMGEHLLESMDRRFRDQVSPDGKDWVELDLAYKERKPKNKDRILFLEGHMSGQGFHYSSSSRELVFRNSAIQAATHHFGDDSRGIPARPFMGLSDEDREAVVDILTDFLTEDK